MRKGNNEFQRSHDHWDLPIKQIEAANPSSKAQFGRPVCGFQDARPEARSFGHTTALPVCFLDRSLWPANVPRRERIELCHKVRDIRR